MNRMEAIELARNVRDMVQTVEDLSLHPSQYEVTLALALLAEVDDNEATARDALRAHAEYKQRRNAQFEAYERQRYATIAYLLDRAEQYDASSGYRAFVDELVSDIAQWRHVSNAEAGDYDDLMERVDRILARRPATAGAQP